MDHKKNTNSTGLSRNLSVSMIFEDRLKDVLPFYRFRRAQMDLAEDINRILLGQGIGVFEAGTGTGKTLSYLVPSFLNDEQVVISTGTKNLQDQVFNKDIPDLELIFPNKRAALLKGRSNYICPQKFKTNVKSGGHTAERAHKLSEIERWSYKTKTGDLTEIIDLEKTEGLLPLISSSTESCQGSRCSYFENCPLYQARDRAKNSDIIVVNHHLLFSHLLKEEEHFRNLFPNVGSYIIDEAHKIPEVVRRYAGNFFSSRKLRELLIDLINDQASLGNDDKTTIDVIALVDRTRILLEKEFELGRPRNLEFLRDPAINELLLRLERELGFLEDRLNTIGNRSEVASQLRKRLDEMISEVTLFSNPIDDEGFACWVEVLEKTYTLYRSPIGIADNLGTVIKESEAAWIFTSATLTVEKSFDHFLYETGLTPKHKKIFPSPFDFDTAVRGLILSSLPIPGNDEHTIALTEKCLPILEKNPGSAFFLFTSHRAMQLAARILKSQSKPIFVQGHDSKTRLLARFKDNQGSILLGAHSFWEGIDVNGLGLTLLIIDKLPFPFPHDPVIKQQSRVLRKNGESPFLVLSLPKAVLALKQGFGRLIRSETDAGLFVIGDPRMATKSYRHHIKNNFPFRLWFKSELEAINWLSSIEVK